MRKLTNTINLISRIRVMWSVTETEIVRTVSYYYIVYAVYKPLYSFDERNVPDCIDWGIQVYKKGDYGPSEQLVNNIPIPFFDLKILFLWPLYSFCFPINSMQYIQRCKWHKAAHSHTHAHAHTHGKNIWYLSV